MYINHQYIYICICIYIYICSINIYCNVSFLVIEQRHLLVETQIEGFLLADLNTSLITEVKSFSTSLGLLPHFKFL